MCRSFPLLYLPPYLLFVYDGFEGISATHVLVQAFFQGIVLSVGTLYLATYAVQSLGAQTTSLFSPLVPILTTLIAVPLLREIPTPLQWIGIVLVVVGMLSATKINSEKSE
ncbi:MAG: DMT family transporter [Leptolyngbyaceae cyanobacterium RM2_2_21]|nr:DMT family transporter [Leptolyngbyaceae cyanobacterium RM2_2_21]